MEVTSRPSTGRLRHRVEIRRLTSIPAFGGGLEDQFSAPVRRWAEKQTVSAATFYASAQVGDQVTHWFVLLRGNLTQPEQLTTDLVIEHASRRYRVVRARVHPADDRYTAIEATDLGAIQP